MLALLFSLLLFSENAVSQRWGFQFLIGIYSPLPIHTQAYFCKWYLSDRNILSFLSPCIITCTSHQSPKWCPLGSVISLLQPGRRWTTLEPCYAFLMKVFSPEKCGKEKAVCRMESQRGELVISKVSSFLLLFYQL